MPKQGTGTISAVANPTHGPSEVQLAFALSQVRAVLEDTAAPGWLRTYYGPHGGYAGNTVLTLEPNDPCTVTPIDLFAISLLNVKVGPRAARRILEPSAQEALTSTLQKLPDDMQLTTATDEVWDAAERFYWLLKPLLGTNAWVTTSKLCARKRPSFFPVRDSVVTVKRLRIGISPVTDWAVYKHLMADQIVQESLRALTDESEVIIVDPPLKVLDVLLWMSTMEQLRSSGKLTSLS